MTWFEFRRCLAEGETDTQRFVSRDNIDLIGPYISALSNDKGGIVWIGMDIRNHHFTGTSFTEETLKSDLIKHLSPTPSFIITTIDRGQKRILGIQLPSYSKGSLYFKNQAYLLDNHSLQIIETQNQNEALVLIETESENDAVSNDVVSETGTQLKFDLSNTAQLSSRQSKMVQFLKNNGKIRNQEYRKLVGVSQKTAHMELMDLVHKGFLVQEGEGRTTLYRSTATL